MNVPKPVPTKSSWDELNGEMAKKYGRFISSGRDSMIYAKGKSRVIKVFTTLGGREFSKEPYIAFLKAIPVGNPFFPKIYSIQLYKTDKRTHFLPHLAVIEMERLAEVDVYKKKTTDASHKAVKEFGVKPQPNCRSPFYEFTGAISELLRGKQKKPPYAPKTVRARKAAEAFITIAGKGNVDMHQGNVMIRNGKYPQLVVIDPLS